jgi:hypothetical protein
MFKSIRHFLLFLFLLNRFVFFIREFNYLKNKCGFLYMDCSADSVSLVLPAFVNTLMDKGGWAAGFSILVFVY